MSHPDDLTTDEGVDEGSAASSGEDDAAEAPDVVGAPAHGEPTSEADAAPPVDDGPDDPRGPGQQLAAGEG
jgi:hypothetical protein